jgi:hypothetical protein
VTDYAAYLLSDFELRDDLQTVSVKNVVTSVVTSGIKAIGRQLNYREAMLGGEIGLEPTDQVFTLGAKTCTVLPHKGDTLTLANNTAYTILSVAILAFATNTVSYDVVCRGQL